MGVGGEERPHRILSRKRTMKATGRWLLSLNLMYSDL